MHYIYLIKFHLIPSIRLLVFPALLFNIHALNVNIRCWDTDIEDNSSVIDLNSCFIYAYEPTYLGKSDKLNFTLGPMQNFTDIKQLKLMHASQFSTPTLPKQIFEIFPNLEQLKFPGNINLISRNDFINGRNLSRLTLSNNHLEKISTYTFFEAKKLSTIELDHNAIQTIEAYAFDGIDNLEYVTLAYNYLKKITRHMFSSSPRLKALDLRNNKIETIEDGALDLPNLQGLFIAYNNIQSLSDFVFALTPKLFSLDAKYNGIQRLNDALYSLPQLEYLELDYNNIEDLDLIKLAKMRKLASASLKSSGFNLDLVDGFENDIASTKSNLKYIDLSESKMEKGFMFRKLKLFSKLDTVSIENNHFSRMDLDAIRAGGLEDLHKIVITGNNLDQTWLNQTLTDLNMSIEDDVHGLIINC